MNSKSGITGEGTYSRSIHAEINALEDYLEKGGKLEDITSIDISSPCCKYCYIIFQDLGIFRNVNADGEGFGSCQGGSYGWFDSEGLVSKAAQAKTKMNQKSYITSVIERKNKL